MSKSKTTPMMRRHERCDKNSSNHIYKSSFKIERKKSFNVES